MLSHEYSQPPSGHMLLQTEELEYLCTVFSNDSIQRLLQADRNIYL